MQWFRNHKMFTLIVLLALLIVATLSLTTAQYFRYPKFEYYGETLSAGEFLSLIDEINAAGNELFCTPLPNVPQYLGQVATVDYACFHTQTEADTYSELILAPQWEQIEQMYPQPTGPPTHSSE